MRVAIIGAGRMCARYLPILKRLGVFDVPVFDTDPSRGADPAYAWDTRPDAVLICTPPNSHAALLREAISRRVPVFVEKPLSLGALPEMPGERDVVTMVGCNLRFHSGPMQVKQWIGEGRVGEVHTAHFRCGYLLVEPRGYEAATGALFDVGWHLVDLALDWFGPALFAGGQQAGNTAAVDLQHDSGTRAGIEAEWTAAWTPYVQNAVARGRGIAGYIWQDRASHLCPANMLSMVRHWPESESEQMYVRQMEHFLGAVRAGSPTCNPLDRARDVLALLLEAKERGKTC